jgi:hypothetical protein
MDFVTICQKARQESGVAGEGPSSVVGQTGILAKIVNRVAQGWVEIQASQMYWKFLRSQLVNFPLVIGQRIYTMQTALPAGFGTQFIDKFDPENSYIYTTSTEDETKLRWFSYSDFRQRYRTFPSGRPTSCAVGLDGTVVFNTTPDRAYVINLDFWETPELLANNADIPALPEQFHWVLVWKAVMMFAGSVMATDLFSYANSMYNPLYSKLCIDQLDEVPGQRKNYPLAGRGSGRPEFGR